MASQGQVTLHGRFAPGTQVKLVKVEHEGVLRSQGGKEVAKATVDDSGRVQFKSGVEVGGRYFIVGHDRGEYREVRVRGNRAGEEPSSLTQPAVGNVPTRTAGGQVIDEFGRAEVEHEAAPPAHVAPGPAQHQVPKGTVQRSDTPLGIATPVDPDELLPHPRQEDVNGPVQRSDTATGQATPIPKNAPPERQEDATDGKLLQRSDTAQGVTTPIPAGDAVKAVRERESSEAKAKRGEPVKAAARPQSAAKGKAAPKRKRAAAKKPAVKKSNRSAASGAAGKNRKR